MAHILLLTDFSENAENAIHYGIQLFGKENNEFTLLHSVYDTPSFNEGVSQSTTIVETDVEVKLKKKIQTLQKIYGDDLRIAFKTEYGKIKSTILNIEKEIGPDYIVVGNRKRSDLDNFLLKGNTEEILKKVKIPVLAVPESVEFDSLNNPVLASSLDKSDNAGLFEPIVKFLKNKDCTLKVLNVHKETEVLSPKEAVIGIELDKILEDINHVFCYNENKDVAKGIVDFVKEQDSSLVILIARKHNLFGRLFGKSITQTISKLAEIPILVIHED